MESKHSSKSVRLATLSQSQLFSPASASSSVYELFPSDVSSIGDSSSPRGVRALSIGDSSSPRGVRALSPRGAPVYFANGSRSKGPSRPRRIVTTREKLVPSSDVLLEGQLNGKGDIDPVSDAFIFNGNIEAGGIDADDNHTVEEADTGANGIHMYSSPRDPFKLLIASFTSLTASFISFLFLSCILPIFVHYHQSIHRCSFTSVWHFLCRRGRSISSPICNASHI
jgi:hypothetical protein